MCVNVIVRRAGALFNRVSVFTSIVLFVFAQVLVIISLLLAGSVFRVHVIHRGLVVDYDSVFIVSITAYLVGVIVAGVGVDFLCMHKCLFWSYVLGAPIMLTALVYAPSAIIVLLMAIASLFTGFASVLTAYYVYERIVVWERGVVLGLSIGFANLVAYLLFEVSVYSTSLSIIVVALAIALSGLMFNKFVGLTTCRVRRTSLSRIKATLSRGVFSLSLSLLVFYSLGGVIRGLIYPLLGGVSEFLLAYMSSVPYFFVAIAAGLLADSIGRRPVGIVGFVLLGLSNTLLGLVYGEPHASGLHVLVMVFAIEQIAYGFVDVFSTTVLIDLCTRRIRGIVYATGISGMLAGLLIGSYASKLVIRGTSMYKVSLVLGLLILIASILSLIRVPETLPKEIIIRRALMKYIREAKKIKE